jgi:hypothetical protein
VKNPVSIDQSTTTQRRLVENGVTYGPYLYDDTGLAYNPKVIKREASGTNTPSYFKLRREGKLIPSNYYTRSDYTADASAAWTMYYNGSLYSKWTWTNGSCPHVGLWRFKTADAEQFVSDPDTIAEQQYRLQQAAAKIYSSGWDALTFIGELKDTIRMFNGMKQRYAKDMANIFKKIDSLRNPRYRGKFKTIADVHDIVGSGWLEGRYGWRTLGYDLKDIASALARIDSKRQRFRESVRGAAANVAVTSTSTWNWSSCSGTHTCTKNHKFQPGAMIVADITPPKLSFNPLVTGWELATLSFVVDRFVNVGQYLESLSFLALATTWTGSVSYKYEMQSSQRITSLVWKSPCTGTFTSNGDANYQLMVRHPMNTLPIHPLVKVRMDLAFGFDLIELVAQRFKAPRRVFAHLLDSRGR